MTHIDQLVVLGTTWRLLYRPGKLGLQAPRRELSALALLVEYLADGRVDMAREIQSGQHMNMGHLSFGPVTHPFEPLPCWPAGAEEGAWAVHCDTPETYPSLLVSPDAFLALYNAFTERHRATSWPWLFRPLPFWPEPADGERAMVEAADRVWALVRASEPEPADTSAYQRWLGGRYQALSDIQPLLPTLRGHDLAARWLERWQLHALLRLHHARTAHDAYLMSFARQEAGLAPCASLELSGQAVAIELFECEPGTDPDIDADALLQAELALRAELLDGDLVGFVERAGMRIGWRRESREQVTVFRLES